MKNYTPAILLSLFAATSAFAQDTVTETKVSQDTYKEQQNGVDQKYVHCHSVEKGDSTGKSKKVLCRKVVATNPAPTTVIPTSGMPTDVVTNRTTTNKTTTNYTTNYDNGYAPPDSVTTTTEKTTTERTNTLP